MPNRPKPLKVQRTLAQEQLRQKRKSAKWEAEQGMLDKYHNQKVRLLLKKPSYSKITSARARAEIESFQRNRFDKTSKRERRRLEDKARLDKRVQRILKKPTLTELEHLIRQTEEIERQKWKKRRKQR